MNKFWMVLRHHPTNPQASALNPTFKHGSYSEAVNEAKRLAGVHPGAIFVVMESALTVTLPFEINITTEPRNGECMGASPRE